MGCGLVSMANSGMPQKSEQDPGQGTKLNGSRLCRKTDTALRLFVGEVLAARHHHGRWRKLGLESFSTLHTFLSTVGPSRDRKEGLHWSSPSGQLGRADEHRVILQTCAPKPCRWGERARFPGYRWHFR